MKSYSEELKASLIARILPPDNASIPELVRETAIPKDTLYGWRRSAQSGATRAQDTAREGLSSEERFNVVLETASLNALELGEYCRRKGLFPQQVQAWRETCRQAHGAPMSNAEREKLFAQPKFLRLLTQDDNEFHPYSG